MKKIILLLLISFFAKAQTLPLNRIAAAPGAGYFPISTSTTGIMSFSLFPSISAGTSWDLTGNSLGNNTSFLGSTDNRSLIFRTNNVQRFKLDSLGYGTWVTTGIPPGGEPMTYSWTVNGSHTVVGNNYGLRSTFHYSNTANNSAYRLGALLGVAYCDAANTSTLGWLVGSFGSARNDGGGVILRNAAGYFIGANHGTASSTVSLNYGVYVQTENGSGYTSDNFGINITTPIATGGTVFNNKGLYIQAQAGIGTNQNHAIYQQGASDLSYFEGSVTSNSNVTVGGSVTVTGAVRTPSVFGGTGLNQSLLLAGTTNTGAAGTSTSVILGGGSSGATVGAYVLNNGNILLPNSRTLQGLDGASVIKNIINSTNGNLTFGASDGVQDITINPTSANRGVTIRAAGRVGVFGTPSPTGLLHIGTAASGSSSNGALKFTLTSAVILTTPEAGVVEPNSSGTLFYTPSTGNRYQVATCLTNTATLDFGNTLAQTSADLTITVTGAAVGDAVSIGTPAAPNANSSLTGFVSATNTVTIRFNNYSAGAIDPASATYKATVIKN